MGSYNVSCSISNLAIRYGDDVYYIPLLPNKSYKNFLFKDHVLYPSSNLTYHDSHFSPACLPILGQYNDMGGVDGVVECVNTRIVEEFFKIPIQVFISTVTRNEYDGYYEGPIEKTLSINKSIFKREGLNPNFMKNLGFKKSKNLYSFKDFSQRVELFKKEGEGSGFKILEGEEVLAEETSMSCVYLREKLFEWFSKITGYWLNYPEDTHESLSALETMSGMFVLKDVYDLLSEFYGKEPREFEGCLREHHLKSFGFKKTEKIWSRKNYHVDLSAYSISLKGEILSENNWVLKNFVENWKRITGEELLITAYTYAYGNDANYGEYRELLIRKQEIHKKIEEINKEKSNGAAERGPLMTEMVKIVMACGRDESVFRRGYQDWKLFDKMYGKPIENGLLKKEFNEYSNFRIGMIHSNRFLFPGVYGAEGGDDASRHLIEIGLEILNKRDKKREEW